MKTPPLAEELGTTPHVSPLLRKASGLGLGLEGLELLAIQRGCDYYHDGRPLPSPTVKPEEFSNAELAVALLSPSLPPTPRTIRLAAALAGAADVRAADLARLASQERCEGILCYIAESGRRFEPENPFWSRLLDLLPETQVNTALLPHPTRFVEMTGIDRGRIGLLTRWIRPRQRAAA